MRKRREGNDFMFTHTCVSSLSWVGKRESRSRRGSQLMNGSRQKRELPGRVAPYSSIHLKIIF